MTRDGFALANRKYTKKTLQHYNNKAQQDGKNKIIQKRQRFYYY